MKKLLLIDGNSILNRAFFGIRALSTKDGKPTNAIYGLINVIEREISHLSPDYAVIAFDLHGRTFRKDMYEEYKANRHGMPEELACQVADAKCCAELLGLNRVELMGYEADDVLGSVSAMAEAAGDIHTYILSGDRDLLQLISPSVTVLLAGNSETAPFDRDAFFAKYGVEPGQLIEVKGLMGDSSDNIPGVPGVGEKTALKLIAAYGTVDGVYESLDAPDITKGLRAKLENGRDLAYLSRKLATILRDAPIERTLDELVYRGINAPALKAKFIELEFSGLIRRFGLDRIVPAEEHPCAESASETAEQPSAPLLSPVVEYLPATAAEVLCAAKDADTLAVCPIGEKLYFSVGGKNLVAEGDITPLAPLFDGTRKIICHDGKHLLHLLGKNGLHPDFVPLDLMLYAYAIDASNGTVTPEQMATAYLGIALPSDLPYAHLLPALEKILGARVEEAGATKLLEEIELPLSPVLYAMEATGFKIDCEGLDAFRRELEHAMHLLIERIYYLAGEPFNINSTKQLAHILFEKLGLPCAKKTKTGYSTDVEVLNGLRAAHPIVADILDYRQITKLHATYAQGLLKVADENGRIHTDFKQALTATGRLSSAEPNLQNIPIRTELGREMRRFFIPENEDYVLVDADYSQIELRVLAHMANDEAMIAGFADGRDIHTSTAAAVFGVAPEEVTSELRSRAKAVNFGIVYGIGAYSLANDIGVSNAQAKDYIDSYFATYPDVAVYLQNTVDEARRNGYSTTLFGRRRSIPELRASNKMTQKFGERVAMNSPIQGTAADIIKIAMIRVSRRLKKEGVNARLVMQVHDELILEAHKNDADRAAQILREEMEGAVSFSVAMTVEVKIGENWLK